MKHPEEVVRLFKKTDEEVLEQSDVLLDSFQANKIQFIGRFPDLDDPFADSWSAATAAARALPPDYASVAGQANETDTLEALMEQGRNLYQTVILYAQLACPKDKAILRLLGQPQYEKARNSQLKLPVLLRNAHEQVSKPELQPAFIAKGLTEAEIGMLDTLARNIINQNAIQEKAMNERSQAASQRITTMNAVWEKMALVCQCAKLVFQNDAAKYNLFLLTEAETPAPEQAPTPVG